MTAANPTLSTVDTPTSSEIAEILHALRQPACYPHHPDQVEMVQTHISAVFLAGEEVYKLKKPVRFSFLDYSTLALRQHYCHEEVLDEGWSSMRLVSDGKTVTP